VSEARFLYTQKPCGCLVILMVNDEANRKYMARDLAREIREGRIPREAFERDQIPPFHCAAHPHRHGAKATARQGLGP
jgi:hypothetical protein